MQTAVITLALFFLLKSTPSTAQNNSNAIYCDSSLSKTTFPICISDSIIKEAEKYIGTKYKYSGTTESGFDCSGYTSHVFSKFAYRLPHSSSEQGNMGIPVSLAQCQKGDLIFFKGRSTRTNKIGHVGIVCENQDSTVKFIHASTHSGVTISSINEPYYQQRFMCVRNILNDTLPQVVPTNTIMPTTIKTVETIETTGTKYIVKKGETLYKIASGNGVSVNDLKKWNHLKSNLIKEGQKLIISN